MQGRWTKEEDDIMVQLYEFNDIKKIQKITGRKCKSIRYRAAKLGLKKRCKFYSTDLQKLILDIPQSYYWAGFVLADGSYSIDSVSKYGRLAIRLSEKDFNHLNGFCKYVKCCRPPQIIQGNGYADSMLCIWRSGTTKEIKDFVDKFDIQTNKEKNPPDAQFYKNDFNFLYICYILLGIIDGDGTVVANKRSHNVTIEVDECWLDFFTMIHSITNLGIKPRIKVGKGRNDSCIYGIYKKEEMIFFLNIINQYEIPVMRRKWDKVFKKFEIEPFYYQNN